MSSFISSENTWALWAILTGIAAISIYLEQTYSWASKITGCVIGLIIAMVLSNFKIIPVDAPAYDQVWGYVVPLAIPLLLYKADIRKIWKESGRVLVIYLISSMGTLLGGYIAFILLKDHVPELYKVGAMMAGSYTGGGVNFAAMAESFEAPGELVSAAVVSDNLLMALYFFVLIAIPTMNIFLDKYTHPHIDALNEKGEDETGKTQAAAFWGAKEISLKDIAFAISSAFIIVACSAQIAGVFKTIIPTGNIFLDLLNGLFGNKYLIMTTLTMLLATYKADFFGNIRGSQEIGTFLIYIFFVVIGVPASIGLIIQKSPLLLVFCFIIVLVNMIVSFGFGKLFKFSLEEIILASNANIGGPTTAAAMAIAKGWDKLIVPILLVGTLGYVIGNYYGLFLGSIMKVM
ncbi:DUF819 domain-containing protein [Lutibacter sp. B2]|nr:DUF819 domain-containing protein [Lutibacter sp. B2]